jgi:antitoxin PrlF
VGDERKTLEPHQFVGAGTVLVAKYSSLPNVRRSIITFEEHSMATAAVTSKGQITIPAEVRKKLGLKAGDRVRFIEGENGEYIFKPKTGSIMDLEGCVHWAGKPVTIEEMNETIAKGWAGQLKFED